MSKPGTAVPGKEKWKNSGPFGDDTSAAKRLSPHRFRNTSKIKLKSCTSVIPMVT